MPKTSYKNNKSTGKSNLNNIIQPMDGNSINLAATPNITQKGNIESIDNYGSPYQTDIPQPKSDNARPPRPSLYRCSVCGVVHEGNDSPKNCLKCDNDRFYKVK
ncbi:MAG: hypothetical protein GX242_00610 [Clostridiales bacterium]|nr:hypothetical protein [Clostridiales bacterium]